MFITFSLSENREETTVLAANQMRYSEEEREKVLTLRAQGLSWRAIAEQTGVKMATCRKWVMAAQNPKTE